MVRVPVSVPKTTVLQLKLFLGSNHVKTQGNINTTFKQQQ